MNPPSRSAVGRKLLPRTTCPHCWTLFAPEETLFISAHADLLECLRKCSKDLNKKLVAEIESRVEDMLTNPRLMEETRKEAKTLLDAIRKEAK